jgi:hypothetical protein
MYGIEASRALEVKALKRATQLLLVRNYAAACGPLNATPLSAKTEGQFDWRRRKNSGATPSTRHDDCHNSIAPNEPSLGFSERRAA